MIASLPWWTWALAIVLLVAVGAGLVFRRGQRLKLRIEPVPQDRIDNTPVERNEIVSPVRVKPRQAPTVPPRDEVVDAPAPEPSIDMTVPAAPSADNPPSDALLDAVTAVVATSDAAAATPVATEIPPQPSVRPAREQTDLFADQPDPEPLPVVAAEPAPVDYVITLHVMSRQNGFAGQQLLERLLQYGLRFGDMNIFHRHEFPTGHGMTLFSMAQALEPGTFNIDELSRLQVPGVSFFMAVPGYKSLTAFDLMMDTARRLAADLDGEMLDSGSALVTPELMAQWRDELAAFERHRLSSH